MNRPVAFLHVIRCEKISYTSKSMEKTIFETKHWCWSNDRGFWEDITDYLLSTTLNKTISPIQRPKLF